MFSEVVYAQTVEWKPYDFGGRSFDAVYIIDQNHIVGGIDRIFYSGDGGKTWTDTKAGSRIADIEFADSMNGWSVGGFKG